MTLNVMELEQVSNFTLRKIINTKTETHGSLTLALYHIESPPIVSLALYHIESPTLF